MDGILTILWHYLQTKYMRRFPSREALLAWQDKQVRHFLQQILPTSQFYRTYYQGLDIRDWQQFPTIDKSVMMANFDSLNTVEIKKSEAFAVALEAERRRDFCPNIRGCTVGLSSGTSGNRGLFLVSQQEQQVWAGMILAKALPKFILTPQRIAFFLRANSNLYETVKSKRLQFEYFDLFTPPERHISRLNHYSPTILVAPPSMLRLLADACVRGDLTIAPLKIVAVAEVLEPLDEAWIRQVFGQFVHQVYQCTEGFLGITCNWGTLHLNEDIVAIQKEYLDKESGKFIPIVTDFRRTTQPIIRYRLDDVLTERQTPCPCGSVMTAIERIEGRRDDVFYLPNQTGERLVPIFPDFIRRAIITSSQEIQEYLVVQKRPDLIEVSLKIPRKLLPEVQNNVHQSLRDVFERSHSQLPEIRYKDYEMRTEYHQKLRRVQRQFPIKDLLDDTGLSKNAMS